MQARDLHGPPMLWSKAHDLAHEVLSTLVHGPHDFVPLDCNPRSISYMKSGPFLYKPESSLTHNQCETNDARLPSLSPHHTLPTKPSSRGSLCTGKRQCPPSLLSPYRNLKNKA